MIDGTYTNPTDETFFGAIGRLTISWAHLEFGLDGMILMLHHAGGGNKIEKDIPWSLSRKLNYLRRYFKKVEEVEPIKASILKLLDDIEAASETRHDIIHGFVIEHVEGSGQASMVRLLRGETWPSRKYYTVSAKAVLLAAKEAGRLSGKILPISVDLIEKVAAFADEQNETDGKVGG